MDGVTSSKSESVSGITPEKEAVFNTVLDALYSYDGGLLLQAHLLEYFDEVFQRVDRFEFETRFSPKRLSIALDAITVSNVISNPAFIKCTDPEIYRFYMEQLKEFDLVRIDPIYDGTFFGIRRI